MDGKYVTLLLSWKDINLSDLQAEWLKRFDFVSTIPPALGLEHTPKMSVYETTLSTYWNTEKNNRCLGRSTNEIGVSVNTSTSLYTLRTCHAMSVFPLLINSQCVEGLMVFILWSELKHCWLEWEKNHGLQLCPTHYLLLYGNYFDKMVPSFICQQYHKLFWCYSRQTIWING